MIRRLRPHLTYANVVVTLLAFVVLTGGVAYAANTVFSSDIVDGQVKTVDLANGAVAVAKLADGSITGDKVKDGALQGRDVLDNSLKGADIDESTLSGLGGGGSTGARAWAQVQAPAGTRRLPVHERPRRRRMQDLSVEGRLEGRYSVPGCLLRVRAGAQPPLHSGGQSGARGVARLRHDFSRSELRDRIPRSPRQHRLCA